MTQSESAPVSGPSTIPIRTSLLTNLTHQTHTLTSLLSLLSGPSPSPRSISDTYASLSSYTSELEGLVDQAWEHQDAWRAVERKKAEALQLERSVRGAVERVWTGREELRGMIARGRGDMKGIEAVTAEPLNVPDLVAHAIALSKTSSAAASHLLAPAEKAQQVPWPTEMTMRQGLLFQMEGSLAPLGDKGSMADERRPTVREMVPAQPVHREETERQYDPNAVFQLDLGSDSEDD